MSTASGTLFLLNLHRRALGDARLHLIEAAGTAAIFGALSRVRIDTYGLPTWDTPAAIITAAAACGAVWCLVALALLHFGRDDIRTHVAEVLVDSGLLYLALEHEAPERLRMLGGSRPGLQAGNPQQALSFPARMQRLLQVYGVCAKSLAYAPYPAWVRIMDAVLLLGYLALLAYALLCGYRLLGSVSSGSGLGQPDASMLGLRVVIFGIGAVHLARAALQQAQRTGVMLALVDVLHGEIVPGTATLTRR